MDNSSRNSSNGSWNTARSTSFSHLQSKEPRFNHSGAPNFGKRHRHPRTLFQLLGGTSKISKDHRSETRHDGNGGKSHTAAEMFIQRFQKLVARHFSCPICQYITREPVVLSCSHLFCRECWDEWVNVLESKSEISTCPVCRKLTRRDPELDQRNGVAMNIALGLFVEKIGALQKLFRESQEQENDGNHQQFSETKKLLWLLGIPFNFPILESLHSLAHINDDAVKTDQNFKDNRKRDCVELIRHMRESIGSALRAKMVTRRSGWELIGNQVKRTWKMICPRPVGATVDAFIEFLESPRVNLRCAWVWPKSELYYWLVPSVVFWCLVCTYGSRILRNPNIRTTSKRMLENILFICFDGPTYELINVIHEAFMAPM